MIKIKTALGLALSVLLFLGQTVHASDEGVDKTVNSSSQNSSTSIWSSLWQRLLSPQSPEKAVEQTTTHQTQKNNEPVTDAASEVRATPTPPVEPLANKRAEMPLSQPSAVSLQTEPVPELKPDEKRNERQPHQTSETFGPKLKVDSDKASLARAQRPKHNKKLLQQIHRYQEEVNQLCHDMGNLLGSVSVKGCLSHNFSHGGAYSVKGRALVYKDIYPDGVSSDQAVKLSKILVIGGIHGDEYSAFSIMFRWLERLDKDKKDIQQYWRFVPAANPDGLLSFKPAQRMNANGVDLNRNFLTNDWRDKAIEYWETKTGKDARRNPGKTAASEPETIWLSGLIEQWQPDVIVSVHAPYGILDFDSTDRVDVRAPNKIGMLHLKLLGTYPGSLGRYAALNRGIPVLTMELPNAGIMPSKSEQEHLWQDLQKWLNENI